MKNIKATGFAAVLMVCLIFGLIFVGGKQKELFKNQSVPQANRTAIQQRAMNDLEQGQQIERTAKDNKDVQEQEGRDTLDF